jgi:hemoglobin
MSQTIFERAGGFATVRRVVSSFYERVLESPALGPYFEHVDMRRQIDHQTKFVTSVMGGPASYTDDHLRRVHRNMSISHAEFVELVGYLREALENHDVPAEDVDEVIRAIESREPVIVTGTGLVAAG